MKLINTIKHKPLNTNPVNKGNNNKISTSKIKKTIATKKNRKENGARLSSFVEKPHSKGLLISRSNLLFFDIKEITIAIRNAKRKLKKKKNIILKIFYLKLFKYKNLISF